MERTYSGDHLLRSTGGSASAGVAVSDAVSAQTAAPRRKPLRQINIVIGFLPFLSWPGQQALMPMTAGREVFSLRIPPMASSLPELRLRVNSRGSYII